MKRLAIAAIALLALTGCGPYALGFTPTGSLPEYEDSVGTWRNDDAALTLYDDRTFAIENLPGDVLENYPTTGSLSGTVHDTANGPAGGMAAYDLYDNDGAFIATLYYYAGMLEPPAFLFANGVVDDGDWFRFTKDDDASD